MKIVVTFALDWELRAWRRLRTFRPDAADERVFHAQLGAATIQAILTGVGGENTARTLHSCLKDSPDLCIATGLAGGLKDEYRSGDILAAKAVCAETQAGCLASNHHLLGQAVAQGAKAVERFISVPEVARTRKRKLELGVLADATDMESFAVMQEMQRRGVPAVVIRSVADEVDLELMCDFDRTLDESGKIRMTAVLGQVARSPQEIWPLIKFGITSSRAAGALAHFLDAYVSLLENGKSSPERCISQVAE